jgi:Alr-MurF fusion protein
MQPIHPTQLRIDLGAIQSNIGLLRAHVGPEVKLMAVVKANAYGHGAVPVARAALAAGAAWLGVATLPEALELREAGIRAPVLAMGYTPPTLAREAIAHDVRVTLYDTGVARAMSDTAVALQRPCLTHIKIDTGMGRLGVLPDQARAFIEDTTALPGIQVEGLFTHFSCSDSDPDWTREQLRRFHAATDGVPALRHACNTGGVLGFPEAHLDMVRPGISLYGMSPYAPAEPPVHVAALIGKLCPALSWRTEVASVKCLPDGAPVGYNARYRCVGERTIAVLPVGYGDGLRRTPHNWGEVLVRGRRAPILGTVCMDQCMIDVTDIPGVRIGDEAVLLGEQGGVRISADDAAARSGTINYEITTALLARAARVYV